MYIGKYYFSESVHKIYHMSHLTLSCITLYHSLILQEVISCAQFVQEDNIVVIAY